MTSAINPDHGYLMWKEARDARIAANGGPAPVVVPCGTVEGFNEHMRNKEQSCGPCRKAKREWYADRTVESAPLSRPLQPCGTPAAYGRHIKKGEPPCEECTAANTAYKRTVTGAKPRGPAKCGTPAGRSRHAREGTAICDPCRDAFNARRREIAAIKRELREKNDNDN